MAEALEVGPVVTFGSEWALSVKVMDICCAFSATRMSTVRIGFEVLLASAPPLGVVAALGCGASGLVCLELAGVAAT